MALSRQTEGFVAVEGGNIWFRFVSPRAGIPLVVIHGGPGFPHEYLWPLSRLSGWQPVLFYDQLGCGRSDRPEDNNLWTLDRSVRELNSILSELRIEEYHLLGHSCGAMIALEHALGSPRGLRSAIFASPVFRTESYIRDLNSYRRDLPMKTRNALQRNEKAGTIESPEFLEATQAFYRRHVCRLSPWPELYLEAAAKMGKAVYTTMWGPTEFICTGNLKAYDRTQQLSDLKVKCLLTCGQWDGVKPETLNYYHSLIGDSVMRVFPHSAHMAHLEETNLYLQTLQAFLATVTS